MKDEARVRANKLAEKIDDYRGRINAIKTKRIDVTSGGYILTKVMSDTTKNIIEFVIEAELTKELKKLEEEMEAL